MLRDVMAPSTITTRRYHNLFRKFIRGSPRLPANFQSHRARLSALIKHHLLLRLLSFAARRHDLTLRLALITVTNTKRTENYKNKKARRLKILDGVSQHSVETVPEVSEDR